MADTFRAAAVQMTSGRNKESNWETAERWASAAAESGARLVALPELFNVFGPFAEVIDQAEPIPGSTSERLAELARRLRITLVGGSLLEREGGTGRTYNTSLLFGPDGRQLARYRKMHLFDVDLPGQVTLQESAWLAAGEEIVVAESRLGSIGMATCYDLRFPELFRELVDRGATIVCLPSAFTMATGRDHWAVLVAARAIENQVYMIAPNQYGRHDDSLSSYGRSTIVDPWGTPLATAADGEGFALAEIDPARIASIRRSLPALTHRRLMAGPARGPRHDVGRCSPGTADSPL